MLDRIFCVFPGVINQRGKLGEHDREKLGVTHEPQASNSQAFKGCRAFGNMGTHDVA